MSGASQQKKKEGQKGKRKHASASTHGEQGKSAGSAAAGHAAGARHGGPAASHPEGSHGKDAKSGSVRESGGGDGRATVPGGVGGDFDSRS